MSVCLCVFVLAGRIWDTTEAWWQSICMQLTNILKYEDKSPRLASWQRRLRRERANKLTTCRTSTVGSSWGKFEHATPQTNGTKKKKEKKEQSKLQLKAIEVVPPFKAILSGC